MFIIGQRFLFDSCVASLDCDYFQFEEIINLEVEFFFDLCYYSVVLMKGAGYVDDAW